jgi:transporter family protein
MLTQSWLFWAILSAVSASLVSIFAKLSLQQVNPDVAQLLRTAVVLMLTAALVVPGGKCAQILQWSGRTWIMLTLSGVATAASWLCYFRALDLGDATRAAAVDKSSVAIIAIVAAIFLRERLGVVGWCGVVMVSIGLAMLSLKR